MKLPLKEINETSTPFYYIRLALHDSFYDKIIVNIKVRDDDNPTPSFPSSRNHFIHGGGYWI